MLHFLIFLFVCSILVMLERPWLLCLWEWHQMIATKNSVHELIGYNLYKRNCTNHKFQHSSRENFNC